MNDPGWSPVLIPIILLSRSFLLICWLFFHLLINACFYCPQIKSIEKKNRTHIGTASVHLNLINWNDEEPIFTKTEYSTEFDETEGKGFVVATVFATDRDVDDRVVWVIVKYKSWKTLHLLYKISLNIIILLTFNNASLPLIKQSFIFLTLSTYSYYVPTYITNCRLGDD